MPASHFNILIEAASPRMLQRKQIPQGTPPDLHRIEVIFAFWKLEENKQEAGGFVLFCFVFCGAC